MSTKIVRQEIERFLRSGVPEVLCISGRWGVGKTYSWQKFQRETDAAGHLAMQRYAYVSLFGLNSLEELRNSIVENTVVTAGRLGSPDAASLYKVLREGERFVRKSRPALDVAAAFFPFKGAGDALYRAAFLAVRSQLICFDDLERAGNSLKMRDVLGLASMLCEQRECKVVLLFNKERVDQTQADELDRQLEKVVDTFLVFEPTSEEAAAIAIGGSDLVSCTLRARLVALSITNIRVMKKIERWARQLEQMLSERDDTTREQAIATLTLAGWCFLQPDIAPKLDALRSFNSMTGLFSQKDVQPEEKMWRDLVSNYGYSFTDELDSEIISGVRDGYFIQESLVKAAAEVQKRREGESRDDSFSTAWRLFHQSITTDDDTLLDAMWKGALENLAVITPANMNSAIQFLRRYGRGEQASELVKHYIDANKDVPEFFTRWNRFIGSDPMDAELLAAMEGMRIAIVDSRDPATILKKMAQTSSFNPAEDVALLSKLSVDELVNLFDSNEGEYLKGILEWADRLANQPEADTLRANLNVVFEQIAARSPIRADKLKAWGVMPQIAEAKADTKLATEVTDEGATTEEG